MLFRNDTFDKDIIAKDINEEQSNKEVYKARSYA